MSPNKKKIPYSKPPTTFADQINLLESRGLDIPDKEKAEFYLSQINYYRFAAYCLPFEQDHATHQFLTGISFDDVFNIYNFDRELRLLVLDAIERVEVSLRSQLAYHLAHNHQITHPQLKPEIFRDPVMYGSAISKLDGDIRRSQEVFIKHLNTKYSELQPPIWAVVELMTMGQLSKWFSNINVRQDRQAVSRIYQLDERVLCSFFGHLSLVRNHAAHHMRLWNREFTKTLMLPLRGHRLLLQSLNNSNITNDRQVRKLYNTLVILNYFMIILTNKNSWSERLKQLLVEYSIEPAKMGFPPDWQSRPLWQ